MDAIAGNPMFTAGAGLFGIGAALALLKQSGKQALYFAQRHYLTSLEIPSHDKSYFWVLQWITTHASKNSQHLSLRTSFIQRDNGSISTSFKFVPGPGKHYFKWKGTWFQVERQKEKSSPMNATPLETVHFALILAVTQNKQLFTNLLEEAKKVALADEEGKTVVYTSWGQEWRMFGYPRRRRPLSSVVLDEGVSEGILADVNDFLNNGKWYMERGIPYRRGYLLHGPPGSGKSSFIQALAGELEYNICVLNLAERYLSDDRLNLLLSAVPQRSIILLEDVDSAFTRHREQKNTEGSGLTFSGFLNALDGIVSSEGRILFMTTNHLDRLDPALIRPGRVDTCVHIPNATPYQIRKMFLRFYEGKEKQADLFVKRLLSSSVSTAQLQGHFVFYKKDSDAALAHVDDLIVAQNYNRAVV